MRWLLALLLLISATHADFLLERVDVQISDIEDDGSARVHESIKFIMTGEYSQSLYDTGFSNNDMAFWSTSTNLKDVKRHINPEKGEVKDFRLRPQPRTGCNPIQQTCHGELILDYYVYPSYNKTSGEPVEGTGLFTTEKYKPRTTRYTLNPEALSFTETDQENIIIDDNVYLSIELPRQAMLLDVNPLPPGSEMDFPAEARELSWTDMILVRFTVVFDVEETIDKEVSAFFSDLISRIVGWVSAPHGYAMIIMLAIIAGGYIYINIAKKKSEE
jgi:hypothetical protein